jgi:dTDP-4-dehydrorhamnose reductase
MRIAITGAGGMLGHDLIRAVGEAGHDAVALARAELDITDEAAVRRVLGQARPDAVINSAAYTNVDGAESESDLAEVVNGAGAGHVARVARELGAWTVQVSSDYVFDGGKRTPYVESDAVGPLSAYGRSKLSGEQAVAQAAPDAHTIVRSSWLFGAAGPCFPATMIRLAAQRDELTVVDDQIGCPTFTGHLASALVALAGERRITGTVHVAGGGQCSWYEFARAIIAAAGESCDVRPGSTADLGRPAPRPAYSVLVTERGPDVPRLPGWQAGLARYMELAAVAR